MNMNIQEVKGTDKVFRVKIESLEKRCIELESIIIRLRSSGTNDDKVGSLT